MPCSIIWLLAILLPHGIHIANKPTTHSGPLSSLLPSFPFFSRTLVKQNPQPWTHTRDLQKALLPPLQTLPLPRKTLSLYIRRMSRSVACVVVDLAVLSSPLSLHGYNRYCTTSYTMHTFYAVVRYFVYVSCGWYSVLHHDKFWFCVRASRRIPPVYVCAYVWITGFSVGILCIYLFTVRTCTCIYTSRNATLFCLSLPVCAVVWFAPWEVERSLLFSADVQCPSPRPSAFAVQ